MTLKEKLLEVEAVLTGNRISTLGKAMLIGSVGAMTLDGGPESLPLLAAGVGLYLNALTNCGSTTEYIFTRTVKHLKRFSRLDKRYFDKVIGPNHDNSLVGYCALQGMYLACRNYTAEQLSKFYELKRKNTKNIVPNF